MFAPSAVLLPTSCLASAQAMPYSRRRYQAFQVALASCIAIFLR